MSYKVKWTSRFKKEYKLALKRGQDISLLDNVIRLIAKGDEQERLVKEYRDHALSGNWKEHRELHVQDDWILIYWIDKDVLPSFTPNVRIRGNDPASRLSRQTHN